VNERDIIATWSARRPLYAAAGFAGFVLLLLALALADRANGMPIWLGICALAINAALVFGLLRLARRSIVVLTRAQLRAGSWRGAGQTLALAEVSAVAVVRALPGWATFIWSTGAAPLRLAAPTRVFALKSQSRATPTPSYWHEVAASAAGVAAAQIYQQAAAVQGQAGPLGQRSVQSVIDRDRSLFAGSDTRWWSPNGECGIAS
jgi:hypothetical protein